MDTDFKARLKELRKEHGFSQQEVADKLNISRQAVSKWENGSSYPDIDNLRLLSHLYNVSLDNFFEEKQTVDLEKPEDLAVKKKRNRGFLLLFGSIVSYVISPAGLVTIPFILYLAKKADGLRLLIYIVSIIVFTANAVDVYDLWQEHKGGNKIDVEIMKK